MNKYHAYICTAALVMAVMAVPLTALGGHVSLTPEKAVAIKSASDKPVSSFAVQFDISGIAEAQRIDFAVLKLAFNADTTLGEGIGIYVHAASQSWEGSPLARVTPVETVDTLMTISHSGTGEESEAEFDVSDIVRAWYTGAATNNGFVLSVSGNIDSKFELANKPGEWGIMLDVFFSKAVE